LFAYVGGDIDSESLDVSDDFWEDDLWEDDLWEDDLWEGDRDDDRDDDGDADERKPARSPPRAAYAHLKFDVDARRSAASIRSRPARSRSSSTSLVARSTATNASCTAFDESTSFTGVGAFFVGALPLRSAFALARFCASMDKYCRPALMAVAVAVR
jgi:hypothetical protein